VVDREIEKQLEEAFVVVAWGSLPVAVLVGVGLGMMVQLLVSFVAAGSEIEEQPVATLVAVVPGIGIVVPGGIVPEIVDRVDQRRQVALACHVVLF